MGLCCATSALCCAGSLCCSCLCAPCKSAGVPNKNFAKVGFVFFQIGMMCVSIGLMFSAKDLIDWFPTAMLNCPDQSGGSSACLGASAIIRMSFALACFHLLVLLIILSRTPTAAAFHDGCWGTKLLFVVGLFTGSMDISNDFMQGYMVLTKYISTFFLIY